jgi:hypothetical protein
MNLWLVFGNHLPSFVNRLVNDKFLIDKIDRLIVIVIASLSHRSSDKLITKQSPLTTPGQRPQQRPDRSLDESPDRDPTKARTETRKV